MTQHCGQQASRPSGRGRGSALPPLEPSLAVQCQALAGKLGAPWGLPEVARYALLAAASPERKAGAWARRAPSRPGIPPARQPQAQPGCCCHLGFRPASISGFAAT